jgi:DNA ligase-4
MLHPSLTQLPEFWTIANLIGQTSEDVRGQYIRQKMSYQGAHRGWHHRHLALVFFDILIYNSVSLLHEPYSKRRALLEDLIRPIPRLSMLAERRPIHFDAPIDSPDPTDCLRTSFASVLATHQEGVVLKADNGAYNHWRSPWVKLKKDYIKGLGDSVDICLLGAGWNKDRGRELRVSPVTYTTFYLGARCQSSPHDKLSRPHFEAWFVTEYGLGREALEELNFLIRSLDPLPILQSKRQAVYQMEVGSVSFSGLTSGVPLPSVILRTPLCVEVFGDRFSKDPPYQVLSSYAFTLYSIT